MYKDLKDKINYEWNKYMCYLRLMSQADAITYAYDIALKKAIYKHLISDIDSGTIDEETIIMCFNTNDIIDTIFALTEKVNVALINGDISKQSWNQLLNLLKTQ